MVEDASNTFVVFDFGMGMPSLPSFAGRAINFLSSSLSVCLPVISGNSSYLIAAYSPYLITLCAVREQGHVCVCTKNA